MKLICFDMDGVIFEHFNFWLELHKVYGTYTEGLELTKKYVKTDYSRLVEEVVGRLWKDKPAKLYFDLIKKIRYFEGAKETLKELKKIGYKIAIVSSGASDLAERAKKENDLDYLFTNKLLIKDGKIAGSKNMKYWPIRDNSKAEALKKLCIQHHLDLKDVVVVCHEDNDIKMARIAGFSIAFNPIENSAAYIISWQNSLTNNSVQKVNTTNRIIHNSEELVNDRNCCPNSCRSLNSKGLRSVPELRSFTKLVKYCNAVVKGSSLKLILEPIKKFEEEKQRWQF